MQPSASDAAALRGVKRSRLDRHLAGGAAGVDHQEVVDHQSGPVIEQGDVAAAGRCLLRDGIAEVAELIEQARGGDPAERESELDQSRSIDSLRATAAGEEGRAKQPLRDDDGIGLVIADAAQMAERHAAIFGGKAGAAFMAVQTCSHRQRGDDRRRDRGIGGDRRASLTDEMGRLDRVDEGDRFDIANDMIAGGKAPCPSPGIFENTEFLAREKLGNRVPIGGRAGPDQGRVRAAAARQRAGIMGRENTAGEADISQILAPGVDSGIDQARRAVEGEMPIRAGG